METRLANEKDLENIKNLWSYSFKDDKEYVDYYFSNRYNPANSLVITENEKFIGALQLNPYRIKVGEDVDDTSYIVGVSIEPEYRGKGYSTVLMRDALKHLYKKGENIALLMPIDTNIYLRYGFINTFYRHTYTMSISDIKAEKTDCTVERISEITEEVYQQLLYLYTDGSISKRARIYRTKEYFENKLSELHVEGGNLYIIKDDDQPVGYMMFMPKYKVDTALMLEAVFQNKKALDTIYNFISSHSTQAKTIELNFVDHKAFETASKYTNRYTISKSNFMMARAINAKEILTRVFQTILDSKILNDSEWDMLENKITIRVKDPLIKENDKCFILEYEDARLIARETNSTKVQMEIGIAELTQLYFRSAKISNIIKYSDLKISDITLRKFLSFYEITKSSYINDYV